MTTREQQEQHLAEGSCRCHDSWDQCPCAESGHFPGCECCPLGTGLCGPKTELDLLRDLAAEVWAWDTSNDARFKPVPGTVPIILNALAKRVDWLKP